MATAGFEFAYTLSGGAHPSYKKMPMSGTGAYAKGDAVVFSSGKLAAVANTVSTVSAIVAEARASGTDGGLLKVAIVTPDQVWRCSSDASSISGAVGARTLDVVDSNTIDADDATNGSLALIDTDTDGDGNVVCYVTFTNTTFG